MTDSCDRDDRDECARKFDMLFLKIDRLDEAIRGNGKPGILVRIDRLEQSEMTRGKLLWLLAGAFFSGLVSCLTFFLA